MWRLFRRDSAIWILTFVASLAAFVLMQFDQVMAAFPFITPIWRPRLEFFTALFGMVSAYLRMSPLPLNPESHLAGKGADPEKALSLTGKG